MTADDLAKILDELGQRLGPAGQHVFALAVRQQLIDGAIGAALIVVLVVLTILVTIVAHNGVADFNARHPHPSNDYVGLGWRFGMYCGIWAAAVIIIAFIGGIAASKLLNPEYAAIKDILGAIHK